MNLKVKKKKNEILTPTKGNPKVKTQRFGENVVRKQEMMKCTLAN